MELKWLTWLVAVAGFAQQGSHQQLLRAIDRHTSTYVETSKTIWGYAELGYHEDKSSALLQQQLRDAGFRIEAGVADEPTAFVATYGSGKPVIAILGEF